MGLDMYLKKTKRIGNVTPKQLVAINEYFGYLKRPDDYRNLTMKEWCGINMEDVDMSLAEKYLLGIHHPLGQNLQVSFPHDIRPVLYTDPERQDNPLPQDS